MLGSPLAGAASFCCAALLLAVGGAPRGWAGETGDRPTHRSLYASGSRFGMLEVTEADGIRYLFVDGVVQTATYADPGRVATECHLFSKHYWFELLPYFHPDGKRCLLVGLGGGLLPAVLDGYGIQTHSVETDAKVIEVAREYFGYKQGATLGDGREFLANAAGRYDYIVIDAFAGAKFPYPLASKECFRLAEKHLETSGVLALNLISKPSQSRVSSSVLKTLKAVFPHVAVYRTDAAERTQSLIYFASTSPLRLKLHPHGRDLGVTARQLVGVAEFKAAPSSAQAVVLTDEHNPLDAQWSEEAGQWRQRMIDLFGGRQPPE